MQARTHIAYGSKRVSGPLENGFRSSWATALLRKSRLTSLRILLLCLSVLLLATATQAQTAGSGSIQGTITDATGALLPNAVVTLTDPSTQVTLTTKTSSGGDYAFPNIRLGTYNLTVTAPGFETYTSTGNVLEVGSSIAINAKMTVGRSETKVEVHAEGTLALQTEDATFKQTVDSVEMTEMPLNGRNMTGLVSLVGGTQNSSPGDSNGSKFTAQSTGISIAGAQGNAVTWRLDGGDNNDYMGGNNGPFPFPDAIGQFSVETAALGAQGGNEAGGLVNVVTRSGTNTYHGSAFEFIRNNYFDADNFFSTSKDTLHQNQYGGALGGPVRIPKIYNGRDKLFFFVAFQHSYADSASATNNAYIPTAANLAGDWSTTSAGPVPGGGTGTAVCGNPIVQLYDPVTQIGLNGNKYNNPNGPFPAVPLPTWNAAALATIQQFPAINPALDPNNCGRVSYAIPNINADNEFDTRVDQTINQKHNIYYRYFLDSNQIPTFYSPTNIFLTTQTGNPEIRWQTITIGENWIIRPNLVNTAHLTAIRRQLSRGFNPATPNHNAFGIKDFQAVPSGVYVNIGTSGSNLGHNFGGGSNLLATVDDNVPIDVADDVTWILGKHQLAFGGAFVRNQLNLNNGFQSNGDFSFNGMWSSKPFTPPGFKNPTVGNANLDFLEGAMSSFSQTLPQTNALRGSIPTLYFQDTFHATPRLTVTAGIRWQPLYFPHDLHNHGSTFNMAAFVANQHSTVYPNAPAGSFFYGDPGVTPNFTTNTPLAFNPNFAAAYDAFGTGKTVFRVGAAYAYDQPNFFVQQRVQQNPPFSVTISPNSSSQLCYSDPWLIGGTGNLGCGQTGGTDVDPFPFNPANFTFPQQNQVIVLTNHYQMPDTMQWTASVQQQLPHGWMAQLFYTGNRTQHQLASAALNPVVYTPGTWGPGLTNCGPVATSGPAFTAVYGTGTPPVGSPCSVNSINQNTSAGIKQNQLIRAALTEANPSQGNFYTSSNNGNPSLIETNNADGNYNGLTVTVQHRLSSTFNLETNYTWAKCLNDGDPQGDISGNIFSNPNNPHVDYGRCGSDIRHNFNVQLILKSHFPVHGVRGYLINNWEFAPLTRLVSGTPFNVTQNQDESFNGSGGDRPNLVPGVPIYNYTKIKSDSQSGTTVSYADRSYLNQAAFTLNTVPGTQGNISRNSFTNPIYFQNDAQISRIFPIYEQFNLDLRLEAYNVLNHPSFSSGNNSGPSFSGNFGEITGTSVGGRVFQGAIKILF